MLKWKRSKPEHRLKEGGGTQSAVRHTFLGSSRFQRWNRATWKLSMCATAFIELRKENQIKNKKKDGCSLEKSRPDKQTMISQWMTTSEQQAAARTSGGETDPRICKCCNAGNRCIVSFGLVWGNNDMDQTTSAICYLKNWVLFPHVEIFHSITVIRSKQRENATADNG